MKIFFKCSIYFYYFHIQHINNVKLIGNALKLFNAVKKKIKTFFYILQIKNQYFDIIQQIYYAIFADGGKIFVNVAKIFAAATQYILLSDHPAFCKIREIGTAFIFALETDADLTL